MYPTPYNHDLVLIGGGHSHALALRMWGMNPIPGVRITLISPLPDTPYSGMLPGLIAGNYRYSETHIDLVQLCRFANARFIRGEVTDVDLDTRHVQLAGRPPIGFDLLSVNSGINPKLDVPGAAEYAVPVKPIATFYKRWRALRETLRNATDTAAPHRIAIVGGGAAATELAFAVHAATHRDQSIRVKPAIDIYHPADALPEHYPRKLQRLTQNRLQRYGIGVHPGNRVSAVEPGELVLSNGQAPAAPHRARFDTAIWATSAAASPWPARAGLAVDRGFIVVDDTLRSISHDNVFAAGDIAAQHNHPRPRAGVFAVRQAKTLFGNWQRALRGQPLLRFRPQSAYLSLLAYGHDFAVGCRRHSWLPVVAGRWVWRWKDRIDRRFMAQFHELPASMGAASSGHPHAATAPADMHCGGCGAKIGADILDRVLSQLPQYTNDQVVSGIAERDDASLLRIPDKHLLVQSVDQFRALIDDPWLLGKICANHALSDLFAMFAQPHSAQALITLPWADSRLLERELLQIMLGAQDVFAEHGCALVGGHSAEGAELSVGFAVNGTIDAAPATSARQGSALIVTKALGTGALFAAHDAGRTDGRDLDVAISSMLQSNASAARILQRCGATACTDITGFGLLGHLHRVLVACGHDAQIDIDSIPDLPGVLASIDAGHVSTLQPQNLAFARYVDNPPQHPGARWQLLFDPQTSGGLLAVVPEAVARQCVTELIDGGYHATRVIGHIGQRGAGRVNCAGG